MTITSNRNATNMIKRLKPKPKDKPTVGKWSKMVSELTEEVVLVSRFRGNYIFEGEDFSCEQRLHGKLIECLAMSWSINQQPNIV